MNKRLIIKLVAGLVAALVISFGLLVATHRAFVNRLITYPSDPVTDVGWYTPMRVVPGARTAPVPAWEGELPIAADTLQAAGDYAEERRSSALLVAHQGRIVLEKYWNGADASTIVNGMSMTKTIVALLLGIAIDEGDVPSIDTPLSAYIPEYAEDDRARITFDQALEMSSGLRCDESTDAPFSDLVQMHMGDDVMAAALAVPAVEPPGQRFEYNNVNTQIIARALSQATGKELAGYLSEKLWQPLGAGPAQWWLDREGGSVKAYCCFFATAQDWLRVGMLMLNDGKVGDRQIVSRGWIERMISPSQNEPDYGHHIWIAQSGDGVRRTNRSEEFAVEDLFYLDGKHTQRVYVVPSRELVVVRVGERPATWDDSRLINTLVRALPR